MDTESGGLLVGLIILSVLFLLAMFIYHDQRIDELEQLNAPSNIEEQTR